MRELMVVIRNHKKLNVINENAIAKGFTPTLVEDQAQTLCMFIRSAAVRKVVKHQKRRSSGYEIQLSDREKANLREQILESCNEIAYSTSKSKNILKNQV